MALLHYVDAGGGCQLHPWRAVRSHVERSRMGGSGWRSVVGRPLPNQPQANKRPGTDGTAFLEKNSFVAS